MLVASSFLTSKNIPKDLKILNDTSVDFIHVDIMDGKFVKNKTKSFTDIYKYTSKRLDVHLMVEHPKKDIVSYSLLNVDTIIIHVEIKDKNLFLKTSLINLSKNDYIKKIIKEVIIEKKFGEEESEKPIMDLLFSTKPRGKNKKNPTMVFINNLGFFDLNGDFLILSLQMFDYIKTQLEIIKSEFEDSIE